jgi:acyl carrier protein
VIRRGLPVVAALLLAGAAPPASTQDESREPVTATEVLQKVRKQIAMQLGIEAKRIAPGRPLREYGADELDVVELVMAIEQEFNIEIPDEELERECEGGLDRYTADCFSRLVMRRLRR